MKINNKYELGQRVYLATDTEQRPYMVVEIYVGFSGLAYKLVSGTTDYTAYEAEISAERDTLITL